MRIVSRSNYFTEPEMHSIARLNLAVLAVLATAGCESNTIPTSPDVSTSQPRPDVASLASNSWAGRPDMPTPRSGLVAASVNGIVYTIGGFADGVRTTVEAYNPNSSTFIVWYLRAALPAARAYSNGAAVIDGKIYVTGGWYQAGDDRIPTRSVYRYNPAADTWTARKDLPRASAGGVSAVIGGKLYVYVANWGEAEAYLYRYNPSTDGWTQRAKPPTVQHLAAVGVIDGKMYVAGGYTNKPAVATLSVYDPASNSWSIKAAMPTARAAVTGRAINGKLYVCRRHQRHPDMG
jgi:N-acetylneuraminic acid mutarotase